MNDYPKPDVVLSVEQALRHSKLTTFKIVSVTIIFNSSLMCGQLNILNVYNLMKFGIGTYS